MIMCNELDRQFANIHALDETSTKKKNLEIVFTNRL